MGQEHASQSLVRLRLSDALYALQARRVDDPAEIAAFARVWNDSSIFHRDPTELAQLWIYHLVARNPDPAAASANPN